MLLLRIDPRSESPAYRQLCDGIVRLVDDGTLRPGHRLPPTRILAERVGVHRSTVVRAYDELRALGVLESRSGSYSTVRQRARTPVTAANAGREALDWGLLTGGRALAAGERHEDPDASAGVIDLERLAADPRLTPIEDLRRCVRAAPAQGAGVFDYCDPAGWSPLRDALARRLRAHGIAVSSAEILVTSGAQHALDLALRALTRPGDRVVVEAPTYGVMHALLRVHGVRPLEVPMRADGMDLDRLERALAKPRVRLVYTIPTFHNPTGIATSAAHRERLLAICERRRVPLVEDGFEEELKYFGRAVQPIKSLDASGVVLYVGALSKLTFPGARVGWLVAPRGAMAPLTALLRTTCLGVSTLTQAALALFCRGRGLEAYLRRAHRAYRSRMQRLMSALAAHMPSDVSWTRPAGGYTAWLTLDRPSSDEPRLRALLAEEGVRAACGSRFFAGPPARLHLRVSISCTREEEIDEGCRRLGAAIRRLPRGSPPCPREGVAADRRETPHRPSRRGRPRAAAR